MSLKEVFLDVLLIGYVSVQAQVCNSDLPYTQTCLNCEPYGMCDTPMSSTNYHEKGTDCNATCAADASCNAAHYDPYNNRRCEYLLCGLVTQKIGTEVFRKTCNADCLRYEIYRYPDVMPTCAQFDGMSGYGEHECLNACLDIDTCRGALYSSNATMCRLFDCIGTQSTNTPGIYVYWSKRCKEECSQVTWQECLNCGKGPDCPIDFYSNYLKVPAECSEWCDADQDCEMSELRRSADRCYLSYCGQLQFEMSIVSYRKTCNTDCPRFEIFRYENMIGNCPMTIETELSGMNEHTCLERCLEVSGCRAVSYIPTDAICILQNCTDTMYETSAVYYKRICKEECTRDVVQTCINCGIASTCQSQYDYTHWHDVARDCRDVCISENNTCLSSVYIPSQASRCSYYACSQITYSFGNTAFRKACSSDCPEFTLDIQTGASAMCSSYAMDDGGVTLDYCLDKCLDMDGCRAVTHDATLMMCNYYNCTDVSGLAVSPSITLVRRICDPLCTRQYWQTCLNCDYGPACQSTLDAYHWATIPDTCNDSCTNHVDCMMSIYQPMNHGRCELSACTEVSLVHGFTAFRLSCANDCPMFKLKTLVGTTGNCTGYTLKDNNAVTLEYCISKCLDTKGCRGVTHNSVLLACEYFNCSSIAGLGLSQDLTFVKRVCITPCERQYWQTCLNCDIGTDCQSYLNKYHWDELASQCNDSAVNFENCKMGVYRPFSSGQCELSACAEVRIRHGTTAFRKSCANDCLTYKLEQIADTSANCSGYSFEEDEYEELPLEYCVAKCLDTLGCRGVTYNSTGMTCIYHNCNTYDAPGNSPNLTFVRRICTTPCARPYVQECVNCNIGPFCQSYISKSQWTPMKADCNTSCNGDSRCQMAIYNSYGTTGDCILYECTEVQIDVTRKTFRHSCASDCPEYKLQVMPNNTGDLSCMLGEPIMYLPDYHDCLEICLDTDLCRAATYYETNDECVLHSCRVATAAPPTQTTVYVDRECDIHDCNRTFTQVCRGCQKGTICPTHFGGYESTYMSLDYNCLDNAGWQDINVYISQYVPSLSRCYYWSCLDVKPGFYSHTMYRKSCVEDCLEYELKEHLNSTCLAVVLDDSGPYDIIPDAYFCISKCLDMTGCRGVIYESSTSRCYFTDSCQAGNFVYSPDHTYIERICLSNADPRQNTQICHNCGKGPDCQNRFDFTQYIYLDYACNETCANLTDCYQATYDETNTCNYVQCSQVQQRIGGTVYRMTNTTGCLEFELFTYRTRAANCPIIGIVDDATGSSHCLDLCLEIENCRGTTYYQNNGTCHHNSDCSDIIKSVNATYVERVCWDGNTQCDRLYTQECVNCRKGPQCQNGWANTGAVYKPIDINITYLNDPDIQQIWWSPHFNTVHRIQCSQVTMEVGSTVWRSSCSSDCPHFKMFIHENTMGNCTEIMSKSGSLSIEYCMEMCLDMDGCTAVTFNGNKRKLSCSFHDCTNYTHAVKYTFMRRECFDPIGACVPATTQTCIGCKMGPDCQHTYGSQGGKYYRSDCSDMQTSDPESSAVYYSRPNAQCWPYQCTQVDQEIGHIVYRESCNNECPEYELFLLQSYQGTCYVIDTEEGGVSFHYCIEQCLDMSGCMGITFNMTEKRCEFHNCTDAVPSLSDVQFMKKKCMGTAPARSYLQTCVDCDKAPWCQTTSDLVTTNPALQECYQQYSPLVFPHMFTYEIDTANCRMTDCTGVKQDMNRITHRRSPSSECLYYQIFTIPGYVGTCPDIGYDIGGVTIEFCLDKCLDMDACRAISFDPVETSCKYHNCTDKEINGNFTFVKRLCIDNITSELFAPVKPYNQICHNCFNLRCLVMGTTNSVQTDQTSIEIYTQCETSCTYCDNTQYISQTMYCLMKQCDRPLSWTFDSLYRGSKILRRSPDPGCLEYELPTFIFEESGCEAFDYDEGIPSSSDFDWCIRRCVDMPLCRAVGFHPATGNCTYHACTNHTRSQNVSSLVVRLCRPECTKTIQSCMNCGPGPDCPAQFSATSVGTEAACIGACQALEPCTGLRTENNTCTPYTCTQPDQRYESAFHRYTCNLNDCPKYEMYIISESYGTCDIIEDMTEQHVYSAHICFERCLETPSCRAVSHFYVPGGPPIDTAAATNLTELDLAANVTVNGINIETLYPRATDNQTCFAPPTISTTLLTTITIANATINATTSPTTPFSSLTSTGPAVPIYIMPCMCSIGTYENMTLDEIIESLLVNLTLDASDTGAAQRKLACAEDSRSSSKAIGWSVGVAFMASVFGSLLLMDVATLIKTLSQTSQQCTNALQEGRVESDRKMSASLLKNAEFPLLDGPSPNNKL